MPLIEYVFDSHTAVITLSDGEHGNRLNPEFLRELSQALNLSIMDEGSRVIILKSDKSTFCLGMDLGKLELVHSNSDDLNQAVSLYAGLLSSIYHCPKPVVCLLNGEVKAGGIGLVAACDIVLSTNQTTMELSEALFGLIPANVLPYLLSLRIPAQKVRYLVLSTKKLTAEECLRLNLIDELFQCENFERGIKNLVKRLLRTSPDALKETKLFTARIADKSLNEASQMAVQKLLDMLSDPKIIKTISEFRAGGLPDWFQRYKPSKTLFEVGE